MATTTTLKSSGKYSLTETVFFDRDPALYAPGATIPKTYMYEVYDNEEGVLLYATDSHEINSGLKVGDNTQQMALERATKYYNSLLSSSGQYDKPNVASTKKSGGTTKESNPPKPPEGVNSSNSHQKGGASLPKPSQGILANTATSINNLIPSHGCPIKMQVLFDKFEAGMKQLISAESNALSGLGTWMGTQISPIVEKIKEVKSAIQKKIKELQRYIDKLKEFINDIKEFMGEVQELISAIMSLPAKLMNLLSNCMQSLQNSLSGVMKSQMNAISKSADAFTNAANAQTQAKDVDTAASGEKTEEEKDTTS